MVTGRQTHRLWRRPTIRDEFRWLRYHAISDQEPHGVPVVSELDTVRRNQPNHVHNSITPSVRLAQRTGRTPALCTRPFDRLRTGWWESARFSGSFFGSRLVPSK